MAFIDIGAERRAPAVGAREPALLHEFFEAQVARRPSRPAIEALGETLSYEELDELANQIAHWLRARGVGRGSLVGLYLTKSHLLFASLLGILKAGAGYVPVDPKFPRERIEDIFADAGVRAVVTNRALATGFAFGASTSVLMVDRDIDEIDAQPREPLAHDGNAPRPDDVCYVIYTSGSTGRPKGVMIAHRNAVAFVKTLATVYKVTSQDRIYQGFSVAFDASVEEVWAAFAIGGTLVVAPECISRSPLDVAEFLTANEITYFSTVPTFLSLIERDLPTVRLLVLGGEACMPELVARWATPERRMLNTYGPTEATVVATWAECVPGEAVTIGRALPGYQAYVLDEQLNPVGPGSEGELFIGGAGVALGYLNRPELTAERFIDNPFSYLEGPPDTLYRTHDMVRLTHDGLLQFLGRIDGQVKIRGFRVELSEIEAVLMEYPRALGDRQRRHRRRPAGGGGLHHRRRGRGNARPGRHCRDAAQPPARVHGAQIPGRGGQPADADQRQGGSQAAAGAGQSAEGHGSSVCRSGRRSRAGRRRSVGGVLPHLAGVGRGRLPGPRRALPAGGPGGDRAEAPVRHGIGMETQLGRNLSLRGEVRYTMYQDKTINSFNGPFFGAPLSFTDRFEADLLTGRIALIYKFNRDEPHVGPIK